MTRYVFLVSADGKFSPLIDKMYISYEYMEDLETGLIKSDEGNRHK
jgi:hypothetical protein